MKTPDAPSPSPHRPIVAPEVIFTNWRETLNQVQLAGGVKRVYVQAIEAYLDYCRVSGGRVSGDTARDFFTDHLRRGLVDREKVWKEGLNWFFREGQKRTAPVFNDATVPTPGQADTGQTPWESRLIERLRLKHYSWRTEQTYREWARRFDAFLAPEGLSAAEGEDLKRFLTDLAVRARVSQATQRQALNALIFVFREALGRDPGDLSDYERARRNPRMPAVLTPKECQRLFEALEGTLRLMAELMYGSGLRLLAA